MLTGRFVDQCPQPFPSIFIQNITSLCNRPITSSLVTPYSGGKYKGVIMKQFSFFQPAMLPVEGAGFLQGGYSVTVNVEEKNTATGKDIYLSAVGKNLSNIAVGSGRISFWGKVFFDTNNKVFSLTNKNRNMVYLNKMEHYIGDVTFSLQKRGLYSPVITLEAGYLYSSYTGSATPMPRSMVRRIVLSPFK